MLIISGGVTDFCTYTYCMTADKARRAKGQTETIDMNYLKADLM